MYLKDILLIISKFLLQLRRLNGIRDNNLGLVLDLRQGNVIRSQIHSEIPITTTIFCFEYILHRRVIYALFNVVKCPYLFVTITVDTGS